ncbi:nitroreductase family protein [Pedobacter immunditicola]|uniref:nitroreductase family protein n=1 Tax=Pedobacter immunditicola TaxID=3133440 RepID=UPI0030AE250E
MKKLIKKYIPPFILFLKEATPVYLNDLRRFYKHSSIAGYHTEDNKLLGKIIERYHSIEKGLTMPDLRLGFGKQQLIELIKDCICFVNTFGQDNEQLVHAVGVVLEYESVHNNHEYKLDDDLLEYIRILRDSITTHISIEEQKIVARDSYFKHSDDPFNLFSNSRKSIRNWCEEEVNVDTLIQAVSLAQNAPSACNRQTSRAYIYEDKEQINALLKVQGGNRGFGHLANKLIIITADLGVFGFLSERNQCFVDGGIFAMNLLYSLHHNKIAACILNCATSIENDLKIRTLSGNIKDSQVVIAMIACGIPPDSFSVTISKRYPINQVCVVSGCDSNK